MIYLMMADQSFREVPEATTARVEDDRVVCFDITSARVATFEASLVSACGQHEALRDPDAGVDPIGGGVRREHELSEAPLSLVRLVLNAETNALGQGRRPRLTIKGRERIVGHTYEMHRRS